MKGGIKIKSPSEIKTMEEGGKKLALIKNRLKEEIKEDKSAADIEEFANTLIEKSGGVASFKMVPGYSWATCVNVNNGLVHGIPKKETIFKNGDVVSIDVGLYYKGFHTDTSFTVGIKTNINVDNFLSAGKAALKKAINEVKVGNRIYDISLAIQKSIERGRYSPIKALVGHGVGRELHEEPQIPCFTIGDRNDSPEIAECMVFAIEVMYAMGTPEVVLLNDGWTIATRDGKISALFEETVALTANGFVVLT